MLKTVLATALSTLFLAGAPASAQDFPTGQEVSVPFLTSHGFRTFTPVARGEGVYIQNSRRDWYFARFFTRCTELPTALAVGFKPYGGGALLSRGDTIFAGRERCRIASIVKSGPPPRPAKRAHHQS